MDSRTGVVEPLSRIRLAPYVLRVSTLRKGTRITIPLNPADFHVNLLKRGKIVDFQLVKRRDKYFAHICIRYRVEDVPVRAVRGVDFGVRRAMATVLLSPDRRMRREDFSIFTDQERIPRLGKLNRRIAELQRSQRWRPLRRLRHTRRNVSQYFDRLCAIKIATMARQEVSMVAVGYPKGIKYENYRGNGRRKLRRLLQQRFSYGRRIKYLIDECTEMGIRCNVVPEAWTSRRCHVCGSLNTRRVTQSQFWCLNCGLQYNADWNSAINIGSVFLPVAQSRRAKEGLAQAGDELAYKPTSPEVLENVDKPLSTSWASLLTK